MSVEVECLASGDFQPGGVLECLPVECGRAHDVSHSTHSGGNRTIVFGETVVYTCDGGYHVNFTENQSQFEAKCSEDGECTTLSRVSSCRLRSGTRGDAYE